MAMIVGIVSQKGGVGKSTLARLIAREFAAQDWQVKIADLDVSQATSFHWRSRRLQHSLEPDISVEQYGRVDQALKGAEHFDLLVLDGAPHAQTPPTLCLPQCARKPTVLDWRKSFDLNDRSLTCRRHLLPLHSFVARQAEAYRVRAA